MGLKIGKLISGGLKAASGDWAGAAGDVAGAFGGGGGAGQSPTAKPFTPYGITTGLATSVVDPTKSTATYTLDPRMAAFRDSFYGGATAAMPSAEDLAYANEVKGYGRTLFSNAANMDTAGMTKDYFNKSLSLLDPARQAESARLNDLSFRSGTTGHGVGMAGGYVNPEQFALATAREQENSRLLFGAEDRARAQQAADFTRAASIYGLGNQYASDPYTTANQIMGYGTGIEALGANVMGMGLNTGINVGNFNNAAASTNANINKQNYIIGLDEANRNAAQWGSVGENIGKINWGGVGGLFGTPALQDTSGDYWTPPADAGTPFVYNPNPYNR